MNRTVKAILCGVAGFVAFIFGMSLVRSMIKGVTFGAELKDWLNWVLAVICGVSTGFNVWKKDGKQENK